MKARNISALQAEGHRFEPCSFHSENEGSRCAAFFYLPKICPESGKISPSKCLQPHPVSNCKPAAIAVNSCKFLQFLNVRFCKVFAFLRFQVFSRPKVRFCEVVSFAISRQTLRKQMPGIVTIANRFNSIISSNTNTIYL